MDISGTVSCNKNSFKWNSWGEILTPYQGTEVLASYADQYYSGKAAAITRRLGKGTVTFIGVASKDGLLEHQLVRNVYEKAGVKIEDLPKGVFMEWRDGFYIAVNNTDNEFKLPVPVNAQILVGTNPLQTAHAMVWKSK